MLKDILTAGLKADADRHAAEEVTKLGRLRGGTSGCIGPDGQAYGACPRVAYLRSLGVSSDADSASRELFEAGYASEAALLKRLADGLPPGKRLATAEELDFAWTTPDGTVVSGRPDGGVVGPHGLEFGVELKLAASLWTVIGVTYDRRPKSDHLVQAAHYSWRLGGVPFGLVYSVRSDYHLSTAPRWLTSKFTAESPHVQLKDGKPFKIRPHTTTYDLTWANGVWQYWTEGMDRPCPTAITQAGIEGWYASVARIGKDSDVLPARPGTAGVDGSESYNPCQYCAFAPQCDQHEDKGVQAWTDHVRTAYLTKES